MSIKTSRWKRKYNVRLSRLELELQAGKNDTGIYECRAMNVAAREPAVGTYTLLVQANQIALVPLQPASSQNVPQTANSSPQQVQTSTTVRPNLYGTSSSTPSSRQLEQTTSTLASVIQQASQTKTMTSQTGESNSTSTTMIVTSQITTRAPSSNRSNGGREPIASQSHQMQPSSSQQTPVVGQPCPREAHDNFCLNKGSCVLIEHIEEYLCK